MIATLNGKIVYVEKESLVIEVGGVGLRVFTPAGLLVEKHPGESIHLHTHLVVREDALTLFGFEARDSLELFQLLLGASGVGPKLAVAVLNYLSPEAVRRAVFNEQVEVFNRVPGVGKKTAQQIYLHLKDKVKPGLEALEPVTALTDSDTQVLEALTALGYSVVEAQAAIQNIPKGTPAEVEERLRLALGYFATP